MSSAVADSLDPCWGGVQAMFSLFADPQTVVVARSIDDAGVPSGSAASDWLSSALGDEEVVGGVAL